MSRSRRDDLLDQLFSLLEIAPWWVGPSLAIAAFVGFRFIVPRMFPHGTGDASEILRHGVYAAISWWAAGIILLTWLVAGGFKFSNRRLFERQQDLADIRNLTWQEFERFVTEAYRRRGYLAQRVGSASGDGGIDIMLLGHGRRILVQCKQWRAFKVGVQPVRELLGIVSSEKADRGILITSGRFTSEARRFAERNQQLELVDGIKLAQMISGIRQAHPSKSQAVTIAPEQAPECPLCGERMVPRTARKGAFAGRSFWGCAAYPKCKGMIDRPAAGG